MNWKAERRKPQKKPTNCEEEVGHNYCSDFVGISNFLLWNIMHVAVEGCSISANVSLGSPWVLSDPYSVAGALCLGTQGTSQPPEEILGTWYPGTWRALQRPSGIWQRGQPGTTVDAPREPPTPLPPPLPAWDVQLINWLDLSWSFSQVDWLIGFITKIDRSIHHRQIHELFD